MAHFREILHLFRAKAVHFSAFGQSDTFDLQPKSNLSAKFQRISGWRRIPD